mgnify:CR=1 FL=1
MNIDYSPNFKRQYKKLPLVTRDLAKKKIKMFITDPFDSALKTHKLHGILDGYWAFSVDARYRIVFGFIANTARFHRIGDHTIYR